MGVVYLAYDPPLDRLVAVKVLGVLDEEVQRRFLKEARFAARVQHPHIVSIYAVGEHDGRPYIAMEYIAGDTLAAIMRSGEPTGLGRRVQWLFELASGLEFAHRNGVVHRDVKPANLIISRDSGLLRLLDFGIARDHESEATMGAILGTPQYMSPEQVTGAAVDARSDIFAFGLVAYELLSGHRAVEGPHVVEIARQIIEVEPVRLSERMPGLPVELVDLVHHCLAKAPDQRPPDLTWVLPRLRRIMRTLEDSTDDATVVRPLRPAGSTPAARPRPVTPYPGQTEALQQRQERRKREVAGHVMRAHAALTLGDLDAAAEAAEQAAMLDEQDSEVRAVLQRLDEVRQERELASGLADAQRLLEAGQAPEAISQLERLRMTMPSERHSRIRLLLERAQLDARAAACVRDVREWLARGDDVSARARIASEPAEVQDTPVLRDAVALVDESRRERERREAAALARAEQERREAEARARAEQERRDAEARVRAEQERRDAEARGRAEQERRDAETRARTEQERRDADARARAEQERRDAETRARAEQERRDAEARARAEQERRDAEARARAEQERRDAEARARAEQERRDAEARARAEQEHREAETNARDEQTRRDAEANARAEQARRDADAKARAEQERRDADAKARAEQERRDADAKASAEQQRRDANARARAEQERRDAEERARVDREMAEAMVTSNARLDTVDAGSPDTLPATRRRRVGLAGVTVGIALVGAGAYWWQRDPPPVIPTTTTTTSVRPPDPSTTTTSTGSSTTAVSTSTVPVGGGGDTVLAGRIRAALKAGRIREAITLHAGLVALDPLRPAVQTEIVTAARTAAQAARTMALRRGAERTREFDLAARLLDRADQEARRNQLPAAITYVSAGEAFERAPAIAASTTMATTTSIDGTKGGVTTSIITSSSSTTTTSAAVTSVADPRPAILAQLDAFEAAYESRSVEAVQRVWPSMTAAWRQSLQTAFSRYSSVTWTFASRNVTVDGDTAAVETEVSVLSVGPRESIPTTRRYRFELTRRGAAWSIANVTLVR
jgi:hypothetical protein